MSNRLLWSVSLILLATVLTVLAITYNDLKHYQHQVNQQINQLQRNQTSKIKSQQKEIKDLQDKLQTQAAAKAVLAAAVVQTPTIAPITTQTAPTPVSQPTTQSDAAIMAAAGIASSDYTYVSFILNKESGWCPTKWEGEIGGCPAYHGTPNQVGYGMCQSTPAIKMAVAGSDWATNPVTQLRWCSIHASGYGGWYNSYLHWVANNNW